MTGTLDIKRVRDYLRAHQEKVAFWHWMKCRMCLGYSVFESSTDLFAFKKYGYCRCGHKFNLDSEEGQFPAGKVFIWDEREESQEAFGEVQGMAGSALDGGDCAGGPGDLGGGAGDCEGDGGVCEDGLVWDMREVGGTRGGV